MKKILITGGSGLIGTRLTELLTAKAYEVVHLVRRKNSQSNTQQFEWDIERGTIDADALKHVDAIIHLAGEPIAGSRWTEQRKKAITASRVKSAQLLLNSLKGKQQQVKTFISASAIGYYGDSGNDWVDEEAPSGKGFVSEVCRQWEAGVQPVEDLGIRLVKLRIGIVLSSKGGALKELERPVKMGIGAYLGAGLQYYSWIHIDDLCGIFIHALENESLKGVYNATAPNPVRNRDLVDSIRYSLNNISLGFPTPAFVLRLALGEMANIVLDNCRVTSKKIQDAGYKFQFNTPLPALKDIYKRKV